MYNAEINGRLVTAWLGIVLNDGETKTGKWAQKPVCPCCKAGVHLTDAKKTISSVGASGRPGNRLPSRSGYSHDPNKADPDCRFYFGNDERFKDRTSRTQDVEKIIARNKSLLNSPSVRTTNAAVMGHMFYAVTGRNMTSDDRKQLNEIVQDLYTVEALANNPFLLPVLTMTMYQSENLATGGAKRYITYMPEGVQDLPYLDVNGNKRLESAPTLLRLTMVEKAEDGQVSFRNMGGALSLVKVSRNAWEHIAQMPRQPDRPTALAEREVVAVAPKEPVVAALAVKPTMVKSAAAERAPPLTDADKVAARLAAQPKFTRPSRKVPVAKDQQPLF